MNKVHAEVTISLGTTNAVSDAVLVEAKRTDPENYYDVWRETTNGMGERFKLTNVTMGYALKVAEGIRIANPDNCVNVKTGPNGDFVCHVTWNCQVANYPEYDIYTDEGLACKRKHWKGAPLLEQEFDPGAIFDGDCDPAGGYGLHSHV